MTIAHSSQLHTFLAVAENNALLPRRFGTESTWLPVIVSCAALLRDTTIRATPAIATGTPNAHKKKIAFSVPLYLLYQP